MVGNSGHSLNEAERFGHIFLRRYWDPLGDRKSPSGALPRGFLEKFCFHAAPGAGHGDTRIASTTYFCAPGRPEARSSLLGASLWPGGMGLSKKQNLAM